MNSDYTPLSSTEKERVLDDVAQYFKDLATAQEPQENDKETEEE